MIKKLFIYVSLCFITNLYSIEKEEKNPHTLPTVLLEQFNEAGVCQSIQQEFDTIPIKTCSLFTGGWDNLVVEINNEWIFRFPRTKHIIAALNREAKLLNILHGQVTMPIPHYELIGKNVAVVGYHKLQGDELTSQEFNAFSPKAKETIAESIALFMAQMHNAISVDKARELGYTKYIPKLDKIEKKLLNILPSRPLKQLISEALASARQQKNNTARLVLIHNDLHGENMAYNPVTQNIVGIFDFTDAVIADFAIEFSKLFLIDADLTVKVATAYTRLTGTTNILKIAATDHIIRRSMYLLEFYKEGNREKQAEMIQMLTEFLPVWERIKTLK